MQTQTIRTTITLPKYLHDSLKKQAMEEEKSLNDLLLERVTQTKMVDAQKSLKEIRKITEGISFKGINYRKLTHYGHKY